MRAHGLHAIPVDFIRNSHRSYMPTVVLDLSVEAQADIVIQLLRAGLVVYLHAGLPCGTCSRAREMPMAGFFVPKPLRSEEFPMGLPGLSEVANLA